MKLSRLKIFLIAFSLILSGCGIIEYDNFDEPTSELSGNVTFNGQPVGVRSPSVNINGNTTNGVLLELWQPGYALSQRIPVYVKHDGSFAAVLFDGDYKLVRFAGSPWAINRDTINVQVRGKTIVDVPVKPYFVVTNESFQKNSDSIVATFKLDQVDANAKLDFVRLYLGKTLLTDQTRFISIASIQNPAVNGVSTISVKIPASLAVQGYLFARIGVKASGIDELLYTQTKKFDL